MENSSNPIKKLDRITNESILIKLQKSRIGSARKTEAASWIMLDSLTVNRQKSRKLLYMLLKVRTA